MHVNRPMSIVACQSSHVTRCMSLVACQTSNVNRRISLVACQLSRRMSIVRCQSSHVNRHMSIVACQSSHVNRFMSIVACQYEQGILITRHVIPTNRLDISVCRSAMLISSTAEHIIITLDNYTVGLGVRVGIFVPMGVSLSDQQGIGNQL